MRSRTRALAGRAVRRASPLLPLGVRKSSAQLAHRVSPPLADLLIPALLHDWAAAEPDDYHRFVWSHHLLYAKYYDFRGIEHSRGRYFERLHPFRVETLAAVAACLREQGYEAERDVHSMLDVGCSLGYLLRYAEQELFTAAQRLVGIDIDPVAIAEGTAFLRERGSAVELHVADIEALADVGGPDPFDVVTCTGVLQYLDESNATSAVADMLRRTGKFLALSGLACEDIDNGQIDRSRVRPYDGSRYHNFDRMVTESGGRILARRWDGHYRLEGRVGAYYVVAAPTP
jgi:SAM-dependent methyltransferase